MKSALIIGSSVCDVHIYVKQLPQLCGDENIISQNMTMGGCAWNVASIFRQTKLPYTLFSPIGKGIYGEFVKTHFQKNQIPILIETNQKNGCCYCIIDQQGERTFLCEHGGEYFYQKEWFQQLDMKQYQCVYLCGLEIEEDTHEVIYHFLKNHDHLSIYFAPGPRLMDIPKQSFQNILSLRPIIHLNKQEILTYTQQTTLEQACQYLYQQTYQPVIVTLGKDGCYFYNQQENFHIPAIPVSVYNTNGAGDSHIGSVMAYRMLGYSWFHALQKANEIAAMKISKKHL